MLCENARIAAVCVDLQARMLEKYRYDVYGAFVIFDADGRIISVSLAGTPHIFTGGSYKARALAYADSFFASSLASSRSAFRSIISFVMMNFEPLCCSGN